MKRSRDEETLEQEIEGIKVKIEKLEAEKAKWEGKAEEAEKNRRKDEAKEHWKRYDAVNTQLSDNTARLRAKEEHLQKLASEQKREKVDEGGKEVWFLKYV
jgi:chromosome segregation ATPase